MGRSTGLESPWASGHVRGSQVEPPFLEENIRWVVTEAGLTGTALMLWPLAVCLPGVGRSSGASRGESASLGSTWARQALLIQEEQTPPTHKLTFTLKTTPTGTH